MQSSPVRERLPMAIESLIDCFLNYFIGGTALRQKFQVEDTICLVSVAFNSGKRFYSTPDFPKLCSPIHHSLNSYCY